MDEPAADQSAAPEPAASASPPPARARRWALRLGVAALASPLAIVALGSFVLRHVPYTVPAADRPPLATGQEQGGLRLRYLGVSGYELTDGTTTLLFDPTPTRPTVRQIWLGPLEPDPALVTRWCPKADFVLVNHAHYDHALDVPEVARQTGAVVVGSGSAVNLARSRGVPAERTRQVKDGDKLQLGTFEVEVREVRHTAIAGIERPMFGLIPADAGPLWWWEFRLDATLAYRVRAAGTTVWFHPTSTWRAGECQGMTAPTLIMGVTGEEITAEKAAGLLGEVQPARVIPTHHDNFFQPIERGLALMPGLDMERTKANVLAARPGVAWWVLDYDQTVHLPPDAAE